jgi:flagellin
MTSILTNTGAMTALQTLRSINSNLAQTQNEISTGKSISSAKDNSAIWAISKVMESDVAGFQAIKSSLSLGESSVAVARNASESITKLLTDIKGKIVAAQEENVDRAKIQTDIVRLRDQIGSIVNAAQFNGLNLINGAGEEVNILASLDRAADGSVTARNITVERQDLSLSAPATSAVFGGTAVTDTTIINNGGTAAGTAATLANGATQNIAIAAVANGNSYRIVLNDSAEANSIGQRTFEYVASGTDSQTSVAANLAAQISNFFSATGETNYSVARVGNEIRITNSAGAGNDLSITAVSATGGTAAAVGGLGGLNSIDVRTGDGAAAALAAIEGMIQRGIDASASFGSAQSRIERQSDFISKLTDSLKSGIGTMVDADLEEASARLQALQVQQQLGIQSLSIANQAPQTILALFR